MLHTRTTLLLYLCTYVSGALYDIPIQNGGFETDFNNLEDNTYDYDGKMPSNWDRYDPEGIMKEWSTAVLNPIAGEVYNDPVHGSNPPEGDCTSYIEQSENKSGEIGIYQTLTGNQVTLDTTYTLSAWLGNPGLASGETCFSKNTPDGNENCYDLTGFPGYRLQLLAISGSTTNILAEDDDSQSIPNQQWARVSVTVTITSGNAYIGDTLGIRIINKNTGGTDVGIDDVTLEAMTGTPAPTLYPTQSPTTDEPTTNPTSGPTKYPTISPIVGPTVSPNNDPTVSPVTPDPTRSPVTGIVAVGTKSPTSRPTVNPTPATADTEFTNTEENAVAVPVQDNDVKGTIVTDYLPVLIGVAGIVSGCFCFCIVFCVYKLLKWKENNEEEDVQHVQMMSASQITSVVPQSPSAISMDEVLSVKAFFENDLHLPQYYQPFIENGYDSMRSMLAIRDRIELAEIGVKMVGHQSLILKRVQGLRGNTEGEGADDTTEDTNATDVKQHEESNDDVIDAQMQRDRQMVKMWFECNVGLTKYKYHELFIANGYESMKAISAIRYKPELEDIGVSILGHRTLIWSEIEKLQQVNRNAFHPPSHFHPPSNFQPPSNAFIGNAMYPMIPPLPDVPQAPQDPVPMGEGGTQGQ